MADQSIAEAEGRRHGPSRTSGGLQRALAGSAGAALKHGNSQPITTSGGATHAIPPAPSAPAPTGNESTGDPRVAAPKPMLPSEQYPSWIALRAGQHLGSSSQGQGSTGRQEPGVMQIMRAPGAAGSASGISQQQHQQNQLQGQSAAPAPPWAAATTPSPPQGPSHQAPAGRLAANARGGTQSSAAPPQIMIPADSQALHGAYYGGAASQELLPPWLSSSAPTTRQLTTTTSSLTSPLGLPPVPTPRSRGPSNSGVQTHATAPPPPVTPPVRHTAGLLQTYGERQGRSWAQQPEGGGRRQSCTNYSGLDEIQPCEDESETQAYPGASDMSAARMGLHSSSFSAGSVPTHGTRPVLIPSALRTYRIMRSTNNSAHSQADDMRVVVEGDCEGSDMYTARMSSSQVPLTFFGSLFQPRASRTPDGSVHGARGDLLPHHYRLSPRERAAVLGGGGQTSPADPIDIGSVLNRASGSLRRLGQNPQQYLSHLDQQSTPRAGSVLYEAGSRTASTSSQVNQPQQYVGSGHDTRGHPGFLRVSASMDNLMQMGRAGSGRYASGASSTGGAGKTQLGPVFEPGAGGSGAAQQQQQGTYLASGGRVGTRLSSTSGVHAHASPYTHGAASLSSTPFVHQPTAVRASSPAISIGGDQRSMKRQRSQPTMSPEDVMQLACSLPTSFLGHPGPAQALRRVDSSLSNMGGYRTASMSRNPSMNNNLALLQQTSSFNRQGRMSASGVVSGGSMSTSFGAPIPLAGTLSNGGLLNGPPPTFPICLICLEMLTPQDFETGEAMQLECLCKGEVAMRHRACAIEWSNVKGNLECDICKHPITNLPPIDPAILAAREAARRRREPNFSVSGEPTTADYIFDAIRVMWVVVIICILFIDDISTAQTFLIGASVGVVYVWLSMFLQWLWHRHRQARVDAMTAAAAAAAARQHATGGRGPRHPHVGNPELTQPLLVPGSQPIDIV